MNFEKFDIDQRCIQLLSSLNITKPTPVQNQAIPIVCDGHDIIAVAQTGTGKTLAFALPLVTRLAAGPSRWNQALILTPTRELAQQVHAVIEQVGEPLGISSVCVYGGAKLEPQARALKKGRRIIVATPGRLLDHISRGLKFNDLQVLILDEADRMLDMGFLPDIRRIVYKLPKERQTLMFSATFGNDVARLSADMLRQPRRIGVGAIAKPVDTVRQRLYTVHQERKLELLQQLLTEENIQSALIFLRTKHRTDAVTRALRKAGFKAQAIHGDRTQTQRDQALEGFRNGKYPILVATDVAARGLDIIGISHVINYDIPASGDDYIHRIGRTARANAEGDAVTFASPGDHLQLNAIEKALGKNLPRTEWEGEAPVLSLFRSAGVARPKSGFRRQRSLLRQR